jgi:hypothetical protein
MFAVGDFVQMANSEEIGEIVDIDSRGNDQWCEILFNGPMKIWVNSTYLNKAQPIMRRDEMVDLYGYLDGPITNENALTEPVCKCISILNGHETGCLYTDWANLSKGLK